MNDAVRPTRAALATIGDGLRQLVRVRWFRALLWILALAVVFRLALGLLLHRAVDLLVRPQGLACRWDDLDLSILSGRGELRGFQIAPREGSRNPGPIANVDYAVFDLKILPLFAGKLRIRRLEVDGMQLALERAEDGTWNFEAGPSRAPSSAPPGAATRDSAKQEPEKPEPYDLSPPLSVEALRVQDVSARLVDRTLEPAATCDLHLDVEISNVGIADKNLRYSATLTGARVLDGARVEGEAVWNASRFSLDLRTQIGGLRPRELRPWLEPAGVEPACDSIQGRFAAHVEAAVQGEARDSVAVTATVSDLALAADGVETFALDRLDADVDSFSRRGAKLSRIEISGARANASLEKTQALRVAGLDLATSPPVEGETSWLDSLGDLFRLALGDRLPPWATLLVRDDPHAYPWSLARLACVNSEVQLTDRRVDPPATFPVFVDAIELSGIDHERSEKLGSIPVEAKLRIPGTAESVHLGGRVAPFVPRRSVDLELAVDGITLDAMEGYLRAAGLERAIEQGGLRFILSGLASTDAYGATEGWLELSETLSFAGKETSQLGSVRACDLRIDPGARLLRLGDVEVSGSRIVVDRDPSRRLVAFGMRTLGFDAARAAPKPARTSNATTAAPAHATGEPLPRIEIGRLAWTDNRLAFVDASVDPPRRLSIDPMGFELTGLTVGGSATDADPEPARFRARAVAPGIFDELLLEGRVRTRLGGIDLAADLELSGRGFHGALVAPYLREIGIESTLVDGRAALGIHAEIRRRDGLRGSLVLSKGSMSDGGEPILALDELRIDDVVSTGGELSIGNLAVVGPYARIERARESGLNAGGLRLVKTTEAAPSAAPVARKSPEPLAFPKLPPILLRRGSLAGAKIELVDASVDPPVRAEIRARGTAQGVGTTGTPGRLEARVEIPGDVESIDLAGDVLVGPGAMRIGARIGASGVRAGALARLLPPGTTFDGADGRFRTALEAEVEPADGGGLKARVAASDLSWRDGDSEPWLACRRISVEVARVDPVEGLLSVGPVDVEGLAIDGRRGEDRALRVLGLRLSEKAPARPDPATAPDPPAAPVAATSAPSAFSRVELAGDVAVELERFRLRDDAAGPDARPLDLSVAFRVAGPRVLVGDPPEDLPAIPWSLEGKVDGLVERWRVDGELAPFAAEPSFEATLAAEGVRTQGLVEILPPLAKSMRGDVEDGTLEGRLDAKLSVHRSGPADLGFSRPFGADVRLDGVAFRREPKGEILAGVDAIVADADRVDLSKGIVHVKSVEVTQPRALLRRTPTAFSMCGLAMESAAEPADAEASPPPSPPPAERPPREPVAADASAAAGSGEIRVERVLVGGVACELRDERVDPPRVLPLAGLDLEARGITTRALRERSPMRFHALLSGGPVTVAGGPATITGGPATITGGSATIDGGSATIHGAPATPDVAAPKDAEPWFDELALSGDVTLKPEPSGWARLSLTGLDVPELLGRLGPPKGLTVGQGALDLRTDVRFQGSGGARVSTTLVFSDLEVEEAKGGPIETSLALPVTLNTALFLLRNPAGEHRISAGFSIDRGSTSGIGLAATGAIAQVLATALAGAPLRLVGALVPQDAKKDRGPLASAEILFAPGSSEPPADVEAKLFTLRKKLEANPSLELVVRHELGAEDLVRAERLANPPEATCRDLVLRSRQRKSELARDRAEAATRVRALLAVGAREAAAGRESLCAIDRELASVEDDLDRVLEILRSPSPRQAKKRTRAAALEIGQHRIDAVVTRLSIGLEKEDAARIDPSSPRFDARKDGESGRVVLELRPR